MSEPPVIASLKIPSRIYSDQASEGENTSFLDKLSIPQVQIHTERYPTGFRGYSKSDLGKLEEDNYLISEPKVNQFTLEKVRFFKKIC